MFVSFSIPIFLFWAFIAAFLPGAIISFSLFRKDELNPLEKLLTGFAIGMVSLPLIPFLLYFLLGVKFSYAIALLSVAALYAIAIALFVKNKVYESIRMPEEGLSIRLPSGGDVEKSLLSIKPSTLVAAGLIVVLVLAYLVRIGSYSPVFQELDPYYYTYVAHQILSVGYNPLNDSTAWYPDLVVDHREIPEISYLESTWYSLYTGGAAYDDDNMHLALIASMYPPIAAVLAVFFIYLLVSTSSRREWGLVAAGIAAFIPVFLYKLAAGEQEVQPYAFFSLFFFYAMYVLAVSRKDMRFAVLAGLAFAAVGLGSSSQLLALSVVMIFLVGQAVLCFLRDSDGSELRQLLYFNAVIFVIGPVIGGVLKGIFANGMVDFQIMGPYLLCLAVVAGLYALKQKLTTQSGAFMALAAFLVVGLVLFAVTPLGGVVKHVAVAGFEVAQYNAPLDRTIAEQGGASTSFDSQMGVIAGVFNQPAASAGQNAFTQLLGSVLWLVFLPFTVTVNAALSLAVSFINFVLGTNVAFSSLDNSILLFWIFLFVVALLYALWKFYRKEDDALPVLFLAIVSPPLIVGIIKAKYTIYAAVMLAVAIGFALEPLSKFLAWAGMQLSKAADREIIVKQAYYAVLMIGLVLIILQFMYGNLASSLAFSSMQPLYQNDPSALASKFKAFCAASNDSTICAAAADPLGYASQGTNYQYNYELCLASVFSSFSYLSNPGTAPSLEPQAAYFRCQRVSDYWINSMEWIRNNTPDGSRIVSWWDYGHWINYFGLRNAVIRNEHASHEMIGEVAHDYIDGTPQDLADFMRAHDIRYALFDVELISGGGQLGGKYGALNYLSCARDNQTDVSKAPGESQCEADHLWETIFISSQPCTISSISNKTGFVAYEMYEDVYEQGANGQSVFEGTVYRPFYRPECENPTDQNVIAYCKNGVKAVPTYCVGPVTLASGQQTYAPYYLNETYPNGDLRLDKAVLQMPAQIQNTYHFGQATQATLLYTNDPIWLENGEVKSGYEDRKGLFYSSNLYRALFLSEIPGFKLVYTTPDNAVKIYELEG